MTDAAQHLIDDVVSANHILYQEAACSSGTTASVQKAVPSEIDKTSPSLSSCFF